jgi:hypothetical protein
MAKNILPVPSGIEQQKHSESVGAPTSVSVKDRLSDNVKSVNRRLVLAAQKMLNTWPNLCVPEDGKLNPETQKAVQYAQRKLALPDDGRITPQFVEILRFSYYYALMDEAISVLHNRDGSRYRIEQTGTDWCKTVDTNWSIYRIITGNFPRPLPKEY